MKKRIAFFDFDGTITTKDTLLEFIRFYKGSFYFYLGFVIYSPFIVAYKIGLIPNFVAKQKVISFFFKGTSVKEFQERCIAFSEQKLPALIRHKALDEIARLKSQGVPIVIVSASAENWIRNWADKQELGLMGTKLAVKDQKIAGSFEGKNCYGDEKVCRIEQEYTLADYSDIYCYGDSSGDKAMLAIATVPFYKPFR